MNLKKILPMAQQVFSRTPSSRRFSAAFTLLELMLVIAVMAVISGFAIMGLRQESNTQRIEKSALEVQAILQAAMAYNVQNQGQWPENYDCTNTTPLPSSASFAPYLPNQNSVSPYGTQFCWGTNEDAAKNFWLAMPVPNGDSALAARIAAHLPDAVITTDPTITPPTPGCSDGSSCYVRTEIPQPAPTSDNKMNTLLAGTGECRTGDATGAYAPGKVMPGSTANVSCTFDSITNSPAPSAANNWTQPCPANYTVTVKCPVGEKASVLASPNYSYFLQPNSYYTDSNIASVNCEDSNVCQISQQSFVKLLQAEHYVLAGLTCPLDIWHHQPMAYIGIQYIALCIPE